MISTTDSVDFQTSYFKNTNDPATSTENMSWTWDASTTGGISKSVAYPASNTFGLNLAIMVGGKVGLPLVAEGEALSTTTVSHEYGSFLQTTTETSSTQSFTWGTG